MWVCVGGVWVCVFVGGCGCECVCVLEVKTCVGCVDHNVILPLLATTCINNLAIRISITSENGRV